MLKNTIRKQSQRLMNLTGKSCGNCGSIENLQRHHPDYTVPGNMKILCQTCHKNLHLESGSWGKGLRKKKNCAVCGKEFVPHHSKNHKTCSKDCLSELGRLNARKRWKGNIVLTVLEPAEMQLFLSARSSLRGKSKKGRD